jgi:hypothetical protein
MNFDKHITKKILGNNIVTTTNVFKKGKNKDIESNEVRALYKEFRKKALKDDPNAKILIRVDNPLQDHFTLKGFQEEDLNFEDYDEYLSNRVKDPSKFAKFTNIAFVVKVANNGPMVNF